MAIFKNMSITEKGISLYAKAQAGQKINFTKLQIGSGQIENRNPMTLTTLLEPQLDVPIVSIIANSELKSAAIIGKITNKNVKEAMYICELGLFASDPDEGEILYGYVSAGQYGDYYAPESQGPFNWEYQVNASIGNAANVTAEICELDYDYTLLSTNKSLIHLEGGNQKEINKSIDSLFQSFKSDLADITTLTGNKDNLKTTNKTNLVSAINEVFTSGNNVKINTVDALLQLDKSLQITKESKWEDIIKNISKISTGKKWAQGTANVNYYGPEVGIFMESNYPLSSASVNTNCGFKPSIVILTTIGITPRKNPDDYFRSDDRYSEPRIELYIYNELLQVKITFKTKSGYSSDIAYDREYSIEKINSIGNTIYTSLHIMRYSVRVEKGTSTAERYMFDKVNWYAYE